MYAVFYFCYTCECVYIFDMLHLITITNLHKVCKNFSCVALFAFIQCSLLTRTHAQNVSMVQGSALDQKLAKIYNKKKKLSSWAFVCVRVSALHLHNLCLSSFCANCIALSESDFCLLRSCFNSHAFLKCATSVRLIFVLFFLLLLRFINICTYVCVVVCVCVCACVCVVFMA